MEATISKDICRLCLSSNVYLVEIFSGFLNESNNLKDTLKDLLSLQISENDELPKKICTDCLVQAESFSTFRKNCLQNDAKLKKLYGVQEILEEQTENVDDDLPEIIMLDPTKLYESDSSDNEEPVVETPAIVDTSVNLMETETKEEIEAAEVIPAISTITATKDLPKPIVPQSTNGSAKYYLCRYCDICFCDSEACQNHENTQHDKLNPYCCNICPYKSDSKNTIIFHIKEFHQIERAFICVLCQKGFIRRSDLKKHTFQHAGIRPFVCNICGKSFSRNTNLSKHKRSIHSGVKTQKCTICPKEFANKSDLVRHLEIHQDSRSWVCKYCNQAFIRRDKLVAHEKTHLQQLNATMPAQENPQQPQVNGQSFQMGFYNQAPPQPTQPATSQYNFQPNFYTENLVVNINPFEQEQQQQGTSKSQQPPAVPQNYYSKPIETYAVSHQTADSVPSAPNENLMLKYKCEQCPRFFSSVVLLQNHMTTHLQSMIRPFICKLCSASFTRKKELIRHEQSMHNDFKAFMCTVPGCSKTFTRKDKLLRHEKIHLNQKIFSCSLCPAVFLSNNSLHIHEKIHENTVPNIASIDLFQSVEKPAKRKQESDEENDLKIVEDENDLASEEKAKKIPRLIPFAGVQDDSSATMADQEWLKNYARDSKIAELEPENPTFNAENQEFPIPMDIVPFDLSKHDDDSKDVQAEATTSTFPQEAIDYSRKPEMGEILMQTEPPEMQLSSANVDDSKSTE